MRLGITTDYIKDFIQLFFPHCCLACGRRLKKQEKIVCLHCLYEMPQTDFHEQKDNAIERLFWGRMMIEKASAYFFFQKGNKIQSLLHQLKYQGKKEVGLFLGEKYGQILKKSTWAADIQGIIPVPLHPKRKRQRGYNQSLLLAQGLSKSLGIPYYTQNLIRTFSNATQTKKGRWMRWKNVESIFTIVDKKALEGKHVLLVDDVITTGATLEACGQTLLEIAGVKVSIATLACAI